MFREMRRKKQQLSKEETEAILLRGTSGVLALTGDDGYPYAVPLSYVYTGGRILFHGARAGHKFDAIRRDGRASFCVIDRDEVVPEKYTTYFRSVILFGRVRVLEDAEEMQAAARLLGLRYRPGHEAELAGEIGGALPRLCMFSFEIEHMSGKQAIELMH